MPAKTVKQQQAAGVALAAKRGDIPVSKLRGASKQMLEGMTEEELRDFAKSRRQRSRQRRRRQMERTHA